MEKERLEAQLRKKERQEAERYIHAKDYVKALPLCQKAADAGDPDAMYDSGRLYQDGKGVARDYDKAREWYQKAAGAGNT